MDHSDAKKTLHERQSSVTKSTYNHDWFQPEQHPCAGSGINLFTEGDCHVSIFNTLPALQIKSASSRGLALH